MKGTLKSLFIHNKLFNAFGSLAYRIWARVKGERGLEMGGVVSDYVSESSSIKERSKRGPVKMNLERFQTTTLESSESRKRGTKLERGAFQWRRRIVEERIST